MKFLNDITAYAAMDEDQVRDDLMRPSPFLPLLDVKVFTVSDSMQNITMSTNQGSIALIKAIQVINNSVSDEIYYSYSNFIIIKDTIYIIDTDLKESQLDLLHSTLGYYIQEKGI